MPAISPARAANVATHVWTKLYDEIMSWISDVWVSFMPCMTGSTWSRPQCPYLYCLWGTCRWWSVDAQPEVSCHACFNFAPGSRCCTQAVVCFVHDWDRSSINIWLRSFRYVAASKHVNTLPQCSPASVGLAQARPNYPGCNIVESSSYTACMNSISCGIWSCDKCMKDEFCLMSIPSLELCDLIA